MRSGICRTVLEALMGNCRIQCPTNAGSLFYCYKDFHSVVLLAVADANACFTMIEVGAYGKENDSTIFTQSTMGKAYNAHPVSYTHLDVYKRQVYGSVSH